MLSRSWMGGVLVCLVFTIPVSTRVADVREEAQVFGRPGWIVQTSTMRVALLRGGGHIAEVRWLSENPRLSINPMFIPTGNGYMGHMVCFPHFGPASPSERAQGLRGHGEANSVDWQQTQPPQITGDSVTFFYGADLPKTQFRIDRELTLKSGETAVYVREWVENLLSFDRPYNWDQHATFGAPFVAPGKNVLDMPGTRGMTDPKRTAGGKWRSGQLLQWPDAPAQTETTVSLREFAAVPGGQVYTPVLVDRSRTQSWFAIYNTDYPLLVTYVFPTSDNPWIIDWQNQPRADSPEGTARGIEFGTSPWDEGLRNSVERGQLLGVPTYRFIGGRERLSTTFTIYLSEIPLGFSGVRDVSVESGKLVVARRP